MRRNGWRVLRRALLTALALPGLAPGPAMAEAYPDRAVRVVVPFSPGGNVDKIARLLAPAWAAALRQPFVVENRAGAGGSLGAGAVAGARPDGYTLLAGSDGAVLLDPANPGGLVDPLTRFAPIGLLSRSYSAIFVGPASPFKDAAGMVAAAKARPGRLSIGHPGTGTSGHELARRFARQAGIELVEVAYRGGGEALADVLAGNLDALSTELSTLLPLVQGGRGSLVGVAAAQPVAVVPGAATFVAQGFAGLLEGAFVGLLAPLGTPAAVLRVLAGTLAQSVAAPGMAAEYARLAIDPPTPEQATPEGFRAFLVERLARGMAGL